MKHLKLHGTDSRFPMLGLGTWMATSEEMEKALNCALEVGYRHIDTAFNYNNEEVIGNVLKKWLDEGKIKREEIFITTKLPHIGNRASDVEKFLRLSLKNLQLDYVDLYLIHVPFGFMCDEKTLTPLKDIDGNIIMDLETDHVSLWQEMENMVNKGLVKNIGLSNFNEGQIENICKSAKIQPQVLQVECHAYLQQKSLRKYCMSKNIIMTAYSPLGSPGAQNHFMSKYNHKLQNFHNILGEPTVKGIAEKYGKTVAQILLRHLVQNNVTVIPKSSNPERMRENFNIFDFELTPDEVESIDKLDMGECGRTIDFSFWKGSEKHPCFPFSSDMVK